MAIVGKRLTLEEFLDLPEQKPALEFVDGVVTQKMSPKTKRSVLQGELFDRLNEAAEPARIGLAFPELRSSFAGKSYVPDVSFFRQGRIPVGPDGEFEDDIRQPPDIAIEIVSPKQSVSELVRRCLWYAEHGVGVALLVDPADRSVLAFRPDQAAIAWRGTDAIDLSEILPEFRLTVDELFATLRPQP